MALGRAGRIVTGVAVLGAGAAMLVLPGPGLLTLVAGLMVLERDIPFAGRALDSLRGRFGHLAPSVLRARS